MSNLTLPEDLEQVGLMEGGILNQTDIVLSLSSWFQDFRLYYERNFQEEENGGCRTVDGFRISPFASTR